MITPTSAKSKQYEALGIDEIAEDIETVFNEVNSITTDGLPVVADGVTITGTGTTLDPLVAVGGGGGTTTTVNISSAQILAMGSTPIELLPAPGVGKYYSYEGYIEYTFGTTQYSFITNDQIVIGNYDDYSGTYIDKLLINDLVDKVAGFSSLGSANNGATSANCSFPMMINKPLQLFTYNGVDPADGDGTLRAIITYTERTFGA